MPQYLPLQGGRGGTISELRVALERDRIDDRGQSRSSLQEMISASTGPELGAQIIPLDLVCSKFLDGPKLGLAFDAFHNHLHAKFLREQDE